ncbi:cytochrome c-type biogenesis protein CcmH [Natronospira proteinivora]|uniref:Cytochrome c-type biogenesis protein CcmH n=1 Tax=Natronospira proteinivora TaxID=1807133 RepID=A0ABT1G6E6_9GAMM|nr:c-type cytochrome biogenesis protein CcmI [Natronospira proteinivora]MCP1726826.1 cytochrome c-type biogenesis protein CcmH [Natronospira proteinivora]
MSLFISLSGLLVLAALLFVAMPLLSRRGGTVDHQAVDAVAETRRQQLADLERELEDGDIDNRTYELSRREIEGEASDRQAHAESGQANRGGKPLSAIAFLILIPVATVGLYLHVGEPEAIDGPVAEPSFDQGDMAAAVEELEARLADQPDDLQGWMMLGRSRVALQQYDRAVEAFRQAVEIAGEDNPQVLANYAEAITLRDPSEMISHAAPLFRHVLEMDPDQPKGLWYSGLIAFEQEQFSQARDHWERLLAQDPPEDFRRVVEDRVAVARQAMGDDTVSQEPSDEGRVLVRIRLADALSDAVSGDDTVFLVARAVEGEGAPLAGVRLPADAVPGEFHLSDEHAMIEGQRLSDHARVELIARVSKSGEATPQSGDLRGSVIIEVEDHRDEPVELVIDSEL